MRDARSVKKTRRQRTEGGEMKKREGMKKREEIEEKRKGNETGAMWEIKEKEN